jgi:phosphoribosylanthranilate isomerase
MRVKVCGITNRDDGLAAADSGAAAVGFVCWSGSPRFVTPDIVAAIVGALPPFITTVGVFVNQDRAAISRIVSQTGIRVVQLHGDERAEDWIGFERPIVKAVGVGSAFPAGCLEAWPEPITVLLDAVDRERRGGTGRTIDWETASQIAASRRAILSGGLRPENVAEAIRRVRPYAVDVSSGVEVRHGVKDRDRLAAFMRAVETAEQS